MTGAIEVRSIRADETHPLRQALLLAGRPVELAKFVGDELPTTAHFGAFRGEKLLSIASVFLADMPDLKGVTAFQLRGMATIVEARRTGLGRALVHHVITFSRGHGARFLWCNARMEAVGFYTKLKFEIRTGEFEIPGVGRHLRMALLLDPP